jgi:hypothetical protein
MKFIRKIFFKIFKRYNRLELIFVNWKDADVLIRQNENFTDTSQHWVIAKEEDDNKLIGFVFLERKERRLS